MTCELSALAIQTQMQNLLVAVDRKDGILISAHKDQRDNFLWVVLIKLPDVSNLTKHVTWWYNVEQDGFGTGHYFHNDYEGALKDFLERAGRG